MGGPSAAVASHPAIDRPILPQSDNAPDQARLDWIAGPVIYRAMRAALDTDSTIERLSSRPCGWRRTEWASGAFETAYRPRTAEVDGTILPARHLVMATLRGGARRHSFRNADGRRFDGADIVGSVSFLPAGCERRLQLHDVEWCWAAVALDPAADEPDQLGAIGSFAVEGDPFILAMLQEMERLDALTGGLEPIYAQTMGEALTRYLASRYAGQAKPSANRYALPAWKLRRLTDHVEAQLAERISSASLAQLCGLSERQFHRTFLATTGQTPLAFVIDRRIERARLLLATSDDTIALVALRTGFANPTHFARAFSALTGVTPSAYRRAARAR